MCVTESTRFHAFDMSDLTFYVNFFKKDLLVSFLVSFNFYITKIMEIFDMSKFKITFNTFLTLGNLDMFFLLYKGTTESTCFHAFDMSEHKNNMLIFIK